MLGIQYLYGCMLILINIILMAVNKSSLIDYRYFVSFRLKGNGHMIAFLSCKFSLIMNTIITKGLQFSFLQSRKQKVILNGVLSSNTVNITSGVPQGSVLASYLFACHMGSLKPKFPDT